ncbi:SsrA-binding protein [Myroides ceti]|uniref:SsrA-binding protein n=1 Tax=Paenimyroides ceti TaxID=395087 RepID=A0ABT8D3T6_9FLAO|nr:SsrA-binding protein [Paenimyroides ceti]MDN3707573.1 SsrA-binding protein [Paenimyroides ceti]MDN3709839.1 SsrA-binding protein [Paenimyroides ceti]
MKKAFFKSLAKINHLILPNYTKKQLDLSKATKLQKALVAWKYYVTINSL